MRLYHLPGSRSTRVVWTLEELHAPYELTVITGVQKVSAEHRRRHALGRVPVLELDDSTHMFESGAICLHLADLYAPAGLTAAVGTTERAQLYQWSFFATGELESSVYGWMRARRSGQDEAPHRDRYAPLGALLTSALRHRPWLLGERFTVADVLCASALHPLIRDDLAEPAKALRAYVEAAYARPANVRARAERELRA